MLHLFCLLALSLSNLLQPLDASIGPSHLQSNLVPATEVLAQHKYDKNGEQSQLGVLDLYGVNLCVDHVLRQQLSGPTVIAIHKERLLPRHILPQQLPKETTTAKEFLRDLAKDPDKRVWLYSTSFENDLEDYAGIPGLNTAWLHGAEIVPKYDFAGPGPASGHQVSPLIQRYARKLFTTLPKIKEFEGTRRDVIESVKSITMNDFMVLPASVIFKRWPIERAPSKFHGQFNKSVNYVVDQIMESLAEELGDLIVQRPYDETNAYTTVSHRQYVESGFITSLREAERQDQTNHPLPDCFAVTHLKRVHAELQDDRSVTISVGIMKSSAKMPLTTRDHLRHFFKRAFIDKPPPHATTG